MIPLLLFTDLDGTLLDHHTYSADEAITAIQKLKEARVPLIFCSSKTIDEQVYLQKKLQIHAPFIAENGGAIGWPEDYFLSAHVPSGVYWHGYQVLPFSSVDRAEILEVLQLVPSIWGLRGFSDLCPVELAKYTSLDNAGLIRAQNRWYTETLVSPVLEDQDTAQALKQWLSDYGLTLIKGGRFWTVQAANVHKGAAVRWLTRLFRKITGSKIPVAAIGDSMNDIPMLQAANMAFLVRNGSLEWAPMEMKHLVKLNHPGPKGFREAVNMLGMCL